MSAANCRLPHRCKRLIHNLKTPRYPIEEVLHTSYRIVRQAHPIYTLEVVVVVPDGTLIPIEILDHIIRGHRLVVSLKPQYSTDVEEAVEEGHKHIIHLPCQVALRACGLRLGHALPEDVCPLVIELLRKGHIVAHRSATIYNTLPKAYVIVRLHPIYEVGLEVLVARELLATRIHLYIQILREPILVEWEDVELKLLHLWQQLYALLTTLRI